MGCLRASAVLVVLEVVVILQACHYCMGAAQVLSAARQSLSHAGSSLHNKDSTQSPDQYETSTEKKLRDKVLRTELIHIDHPDSPLSKAYNTSSYSERLAAAVERSLARRHHFSRRLSSIGGFESEVIPDDKAVPTYLPLTEYTMALSIGTPPQRFFPLIDTGSDLIWLNCKPCNNCNGSFSYGTPFDPSLSSSYANASCKDESCQNFEHGQNSGVEGGCEAVSNVTTCQYVAQYGSGLTSQGNVAYETLTVTNIDGWSTSIPILFGCGHNQTNNAFFGADGIVGLGKSGISLSSQIRNIYPEIFSYCLVPFYSSTKNTSTIFFGTPENFKFSSDFVYTPLVNNSLSLIPSLYYVNLTGISVNGTLLNIPPGTFALNTTDGSGGVLLDSGGAFTFLDDVGYNVVSQELLKLINLPLVNQTINFLPVCFNLTNASIEVFPTITFHFVDAAANGNGKTVDFLLTPVNYISFYLEPQLSCLTLLSSSSSGLPVSIIGNHAQANHQLVFDQVHGQIGWASRDCSML